MKTKCLHACLMAILISGCSRSEAPAPPPGPAPAPPGPAAMAPPLVAIVPDSYVWDGFEFVGEFGGGFYYFGPGGAWVACDPVRLERFHGWERGHPDWRSGAIRDRRPPARHAQR